MGELKRKAFVKKPNIFDEMPIQLHDFVPNLNWLGLKIEKQNNVSKNKGV